MFSLPALKCVRDSFPKAFIASVVRPSLRDLLASTGLVDEVMVRPTGLSVGKLALAWRLRSPGFDLALVFSQSASSALFACLSRAHKRVGFLNASCGRLLNQHVDFRHPPSTANNLRLVKAAGCDVTVVDYAGLMKPSESDCARAEQLLSACGIGPEDRVAALAPGTSGRRSVKEWTDEGFAAVGRHLVRQGVKVVVVGSFPASSIVQQYGEILDLSGKTSLAEAAAVLKRCEALVSVDSGILHVCAAVGTKVVGLYGPSNPRITGPQGEGHVVLTSHAECSPCMRTECKYDRECMTNLDVSAVIEAVDSVLTR